MQLREVVARSGPYHPKALPQVLSEGRFPKMLLSPEHALHKSGRVPEQPHAAAPGRPPCRVGSFCAEWCFQAG
jgi:hypothetical protein